ncbi:hypothetical protein ACRALDRAFT_1063683, partial [Sodiomyces alcalophilus JCM 7366]|uniref:uncharacterized protein n=1 Tax=Sodiomyces alcalophilus JCM 7366 TaxID=591952 RepID=UPI0039B49301
MPGRPLINALLLRRLPIPYFTCPFQTRHSTNLALAAHRLGSELGWMLLSAQPRVSNDGKEKENLQRRSNYPDYHV